MDSFIRTAAAAAAGTAIALLVGIFSLQNYNDGVEVALASSVTLQADGRNVCGATVVDLDGKIITAGHCVVDPTTKVTRSAAMSVMFRDGSTRPVFIESISLAYDLAVLRLEDNVIRDEKGYATGYRCTGDQLCADHKLVAAQVGLTPQAGNDIFVIGSPLGEEFQITKGTFSVAHKEMKQYSPHDVVDRLSISVFPGNSGGGVFNKAGELVGVVSRVRQMGMGMVSVPTSIGVSVPADDIRKVI